VAVALAAQEEFDDLLDRDRGGVRDFQAVETPQARSPLAGGTCRSRPAQHLGRAAVAGLVGAGLILVAALLALLAATGTSELSRVGTAEVRRPLGLGGRVVALSADGPDEEEDVEQRGKDRKETDGHDHDRKDVVEGHKKVVTDRKEAAEVHKGLAAHTEAAAREDAEDRHEKSATRRKSGRSHDEEEESEKGEEGEEGEKGEMGKEGDNSEEEAGDNVFAKIEQGISFSLRREKLHIISRAGEHEWEVIVRPAVYVRHNKSLEGKILSLKKTGAVVLGRREGPWLALEGEKGYMRIAERGKVLMQRREILYAMIPSGRCSDIGYFLITDVAFCDAAAAALGLSDTTATTATAVEAAPEGCYWKGEGLFTPVGRRRLREHGDYAGQGELWMALDEANKGNGAAEGRLPICSSRGYPAPTATSTSTMTTSTSTMTTSSHVSFPSLLCFEVMRAYTPEEELVKMQFKLHVSIFACDDHIVISNEKVLLGHNASGDPVYTWKNPAPPLSMGVLGGDVTTNSWLNTQVFIDAFASIIADKKGRLWKHDWLVKVDPDAVFHPERLRWHLKAHTPGSAYFTNCNCNGPKLYGSLEVFSRQAMGAYKDMVETCLALNWHGWGEDSYMQKCMDAIGVPMIADYTLVGDSRCMAAPCTDGYRAAFHPFKDISNWRHCWNASA